MIITSRPFLTYKPRQFQVTKRMMKTTDGDRSDSDSEGSIDGHFITRGAFLLTPSHDLNMDKASAILEKMNFRGPFSLTKTATGILFKFADTEDFQATFKKGFHKVTGARFYKKVPIPCRPQKTFIVYVFDVPEDLPEEDIRHALYKFNSVVEVTRLPYSLVQQPQSPPQPPTQQVVAGVTRAVEKNSGPEGFTVPIIRVTLASIDEAHVLLQNGLDFFGATYFPTELADGNQLVKSAVRRSAINRLSDGTIRVKDILPVFDATGFAKIPPPPSKTIKPKI